MHCEILLLTENHKCSLLTRAEIPCVAAEGANQNYVLFTLNQMRADILGEQRKLIEGTSAVLHEVKDLR
jgi:hypothetical protein